MVITRLDTPIDPVTRRCFRCGATKPIEEFRFRRRETGQRHGDCRTCHCETQRVLRAQHRQHGFNWLATTVHHRRDRGAEWLGKILAAMAVKLGGIERFTEAWVSDLKRARRDGDHPTFCKYTRMFVELHVAHQSVRGARQDAELPSVPNANLEAELREEIVAMLISAGKTDDAARTIVGELRAGWSGLGER